MLIKPVRKHYPKGNMFLSLEKKEEISKCKGRIYRAKVNHFLNKNEHYIYQERMIPMKRMSCEGCDVCGWADEHLREFSYFDTPLIMDEPIKHDQLYELIVCNLGYDWETGICDEWDLAFVKIGEEECHQQEENLSKKQA